MKTTALALSILLASVSLFAQENGSEEKFKYSNITEFGFITVSPQSFAFDGTTAHGFSVNKSHHLGLGLGLGGNLDFGFYMPLFLNYRYYFHQEKKMSPHINVSLGGLWVEEGGGLYSAVTVGFKAGAFSFASGLSFMAVQERSYFYYDYNYRVRDGWYVYYPFGLVLKCGFAF